MSAKYEAGWRFFKTIASTRRVHHCCSNLALRFVIIDFDIGGAKFACVICKRCANHLVGL